MGKRTTEPAAAGVAPSTRRYTRSRDEEYNVLLTVRVTNNLDAAMDKYLHKGKGYLLYDSKAEFIRDAIYNQLEAVKGTDGSTTIIGALRLLNATAHDELVEQELVDTVANMERALRFYVREKALDRIAEVLANYYAIILRIESKFWAGYLQQRMQESAVFQEARGMLGDDDEVEQPGQDMAEAAGATGGKAEAKAG